VSHRAPPLRTKRGLTYAASPVPCPARDNERLFSADLSKAKHRGGKYDFRDNNWIPSDAMRGELAESWQWAEPLKLDVKLRKGVMFPEKKGVMAARELVADDVVGTYQLFVASPKAIKRSSAPALKSQWVEGSGSYLSLRMDTKPFDDIRVRRALNISIDTAAIVKSYYGGHAELFAYPMHPDWTDYYEPLAAMPAWWPWVKNYGGELRGGGGRPAPVYARVWIDQAMKKRMGYD